MDSGYPHHPGAYPIDTAIAAADYVAPAVPQMHKQIIQVIADAGVVGATGDEIARVLRWERFRVRPRTSELRVKRQIVDSGKRRKSESGINSIVWVLPKFADRKVATNG